MDWLKVINCLEQQQLIYTRQSMENKSYGFFANICYIFATALRAGIKE